MAGSSLFFNSIAVPVCFLKLGRSCMGPCSVITLRSPQALWPCFRHRQQWILGVLPLDGLMIILYSMSMLPYPFHTVTHFIKMIAKYSLGSSEVAHKRFWSEWWHKLPTYVMIMLVGFRDTFMITKPMGITWTTQEALLFSSKIRYSKHWLFSLLA